jgi:HK97 family phage major capsid protein
VTGTSTATGLTVDGIIDAVADVEAAGGTATIAWVNPADWATLAKALTDHAAIAPTADLQRQVLGVKVVTTSHVAAGTIWVADGSHVVAVIRTDGQVDVSGDIGFTRDQTYVRVTSRIGFAYPFPLTVCEISAA